MGAIGISGCILFTVYGQLMLKWRLSLKGPLPAETKGQVFFLLNALLDPFVLSAFAAAFIASLFWMTAMTKYDVSFAYPFMSLAFVGVLIFGAVFFNEPLTIGKIVGLALIVAGIITAVKL